MPEAQSNSEFAAIVNGSRDIDSAAEEIVSGKPATAAVTEIIDPVEAWAEIPAMVGQMLTLALPELKAVYTPLACKEWGKAMHRLATKRQWAADGLPPEVGVAMVSAGLVIPTVIAIKIRRDQARLAKVAQQQTGESQQPGSGHEAAAAAQ